MLFIPMKEIAVGDYSPEYGTVKSLVILEDQVRLTFINGKEIQRDKDDELEVDQGGRFASRPFNS